MPVDVIHTALGLSFLFIWAVIGQIAVSDRPAHRAEQVRIDTQHASGRAPYFHV